MKRAAYWLLVMVLLALTGMSHALAEEDVDSLTLFVYMTGSDLESNGGAATRDITEMLRSGVDVDRVNILLMTGGAKKWWGGFPNDSVCVYRAAGARPELLCQTEMASMGKPETLAQFLNYGCENYPAEQYALILWDHGGGPLEGVCFDEIFESDSLSMMELKSALEASPFNEQNPLEWIGFDACLMSSAETAYICAPHARYMIASQETEPGTGWNYSFLKGLEEGIDGAETGRRIVDGYFAGADSQIEENLTLACVDLSRIHAVETAMDNLFGELDEIISPEIFSMLSNSRRDTKSFGRATTGSDYDLVDLYHLALQYAMVAPEGADALLAAVEDAVVYQRSGSENCHGLSIYYPYYNKDRYKSVWEDQHTALNFSKGYMQYLSDYADLWLGDTMADWRGMQTKSRILEGDAQEITIALTEDQAAHFAFAELYILDTFGTDGAYYDVYHMDDVRLDGDVLRTRYEYQALYALDGNGKPLTNALHYFMRDGTYFVRVVLSNVSSEKDFLEWAGSELVTAYLQCRLDPDTDELKVIGVMELPDAAALEYISEEDLLLSGKQTLTLDPDDWAWIQFPTLPKVRVAAEDGQPVPYSQWPSYSQYYEALLAEYFDVDNRAPWTLKFCKDQFGGSNLSAQYVVHDTQGELFASDLLPIENPNVSWNADEETELLDEEDLRIALTSVEVVESEMEPGLFLYMRVEGGGGDRIALRMEHIAFDKTAISYDAFSSILKSGNAFEAMFEIPASEFPPLKNSCLQSLSFDMVVTRNEQYDASQSRSVCIQQEIDLGSLCNPMPELDVPLAQTRVGGVEYQLLNLSESEDGTLYADLRIVNDNTRLLDECSMSGDSIVNGCYFSGNCDGEVVSVPAGCDHYTTVKIDRTIADASDILSDGTFQQTDGFDYWDIETVEELALFAFFDSRKIAIPFVLNEPFALSRKPQAQWEEELLSTDELSIALRGVVIEAGKARMDIVIQNHTDSELEMMVKEALVDGETVEVTLEVGEEHIPFITNKLKPGLTQRGILVVPLPIRDKPERLELSFSFRGDGEKWEHCSAATIEGLDGDAQTLRIAKGEKIEWVASELSALVNPEVAMPEDAGQYRVTLATQLTPEQVQAMESAIAVIVEWEEWGCYRILCLCDNILPDEDGWLRAEYCGLVPCVLGEREPLTLYQNADGTVMDIKGVNIYEDGWAGDVVHFTSIPLLLDEAGQARIGEVKADREVYAHEQFEVIVNCFVEYVPSYNEDGSLQDTRNWKEPGMIRAKNYPLNGEPASFMMRPADEYEFYVIFNVRNQDGTGYTLDPVPYAQAALR